MIQIDDAGSGSFVGGTCIGIYRPETNEYYFDIIPVEFYTKDTFQKKLYLDEVVKITSEAFHLLNVQKSEVIEICRGYMFEKLQKWLEEENFCCYRTHITGPVQEIIEKSFMLYTIKLGVPEQYIKYTRYPFHFHKLLRWVYADYDNRIGLCKTGWKSWEKLQDTTLNVSQDTAHAGHFVCLKCGKGIKKGSEIKVLRYFSNRENYIYLHIKC